MKRVYTQKKNNGGTYIFQVANKTQKPSEFSFRRCDNNVKAPTSYPRKKTKNTSSRN